MYRRRQQSQAQRLNDCLNIDKLYYATKVLIALRLLVPVISDLML